MSANYYQTLGVTINASISEIKKAFKVLALRFHPDKNSAPTAAARFREIDEAYKILTDSMLKSIYDRHGRAAVHAYKEQRQRRESSEVITLDDSEDERGLSAANTPTTSTVAFTVPFTIPFPNPNTTTSTVAYAFRYTVTSTVAFIFPIADNHTACRHSTTATSA
ncbi:DnaJ sub B member 5 [Globodera pallida]|nr:DnaJ sub B member 5 [Globodera pallida]